MNDLNPPRAGERLIGDFDDRFVSRAEVLHLTGIRSPSTIYSLINSGDFPAPYQITPGRVGWSYAELQHWVAERKKARGSRQVPGWRELYD